MPHEDERKTANPLGVHIPVEHIRETIMPPYEYKKPENGFGILVVGNQPPTETGTSKKEETA